MAKYTQTLQEYCQSVYLGQQLEINPAGDWYQIVAGMQESDYYRIVRDYVLPNPLPFYNESTLDKEEFIRDFTDRFLYFEIGQDSFPKFRQTLKAWLRQSMPYYGQLYGSQLSGLNELIDNVNLVITRKGELSKKNGTLGRSGSTTYGRIDTTKSTITNKSSIVPLGSSDTEREISQQVTATPTAGDSVTASGTDTTGYTDTYTNLKDETDITETHTGHDGHDIAQAVEKYRALIVDMNTTIFDAMKAYGLVMLVW